MLDELSHQRPDEARCGCAFFKIWSDFLVERHVLAVFAQRFSVRGHCEDARHRDMNRLIEATSAPPKNAKGDVRYRKQRHIPYRFLIRGASPSCLSGCRRMEIPAAIVALH